MTKGELISAVAAKAGITRKNAASAVNAATDAITESLAKGKKVEIRGFGTFLMKERAARVARNPRTGQKVNVPAKIVPAFRAGKELKEATEKKVKKGKRK